MSDKNDKPEVSAALPELLGSEDGPITESATDGELEPEEEQEADGFDDLEDLASSVLVVPPEIAGAMVRFHRLLQTPTPRGELARGVMKVVKSMQRQDYESMRAAMREFDALVAEFQLIGQHEDERTLTPRDADEELPLPLVLRMERTEA